MTDPVFLPGNYLKKNNMICPHCITKAHFIWNCTPVLKTEMAEMIGTGVEYAACPACNELIVSIRKGLIEYGTDDYVWKNAFDRKIVYPQMNNGFELDNIPKDLVDDYTEAKQILAVSPKASAALTRRLLQTILRDKFELKAPSLSQEIHEFVKLPGVPTHITDAVDAVRNIGNFAAHPTKDKTTGEIVDVEKGEAEWLIEVIEALFDFAYIQPMKLNRRRKDLNNKLEAIGKPPMK